MVLNKAAIAEALAMEPDALAPSLLMLTTAWTVKRRGVEIKLILDAHRRPRDPVLVRTLALGRCYMDALKAGRSIAGIARDHDVTPAWIARHIDAALLAPQIVQVILDGAQPADLTATKLRETPLPARWADQHRALGLLADV
ncbi:MAG: hypothetical protein AAF360_07545 [Pseudomonadota bacterium]